MNQAFGTNPTSQALIEASALKVDKRWEKKQAESLKAAKAAHDTHKASIKNLMSHISAAVENHGKNDTVNWGHEGSLHHVHNRLLDLHKFLSPNKYNVESTAVREETENVDEGWAEKAVSR